jgi:hypothetical protein
VIRQRLRQVGIVATLLLAMAACGPDESSDPTTTTEAPAATATQAAVAPTAKAPDQPGVNYTTSFEDDAADLFFTGETTFGALASIVDGRYVVEVEDGEWQTITPGPMLHPNDGVIEAEVTLEGSGFAGLVARSSVDAGGNDWMYSCLFDETGWAGCVASIGSTYQDLFFGAIQDFDVDATQHLRMTVVSDRIELVVNGQVIGAAQHGLVKSGAWGILAESQDEGQTVVTFDNLSIASVQT